MRLFEFTTILLEYNRDITKKKLGDKILAAAARDRIQDLDEILSAFEDTDPTRNKEYIQWISAQYIKKQFRFEDLYKVKDLLVNFDKLKPRLPQRDINRFDYRSLYLTIDAIVNPELGVKTDNEVFSVPDDTEVLYNGPYGLLVVPKTKEASCEVGRGTEWCTAYTKADNMFDEYNADGPIYVWRDRNGDRYQFHFESAQFMDIHDHPIQSNVLHNFRNNHPVLSKLFKKNEINMIVAYAYGDSLTDFEDVCYYSIDITDGVWPEAEEYLLSHASRIPEATMMYAVNVKNKNWPELEKHVLKRPDLTVKYAYNVKRQRWKEVESFILTDPVAAYEYAVYFNFRWKEAERIIIKDGDAAARYAIQILKGPWPEAERVIAKDLHALKIYLHYFDRSSAIENTLINSAKNAKYKKDIAKSIAEIKLYFDNVKQSPWPEAEPYFLRIPGLADEYMDQLKSLRFKEHVIELAKKGYPDKRTANWFLDYYEIPYDS